MGETVAAAGLHAEMVDEKRASVAAERRSSVVTDPQAPAAAVSSGGVTADGQFPTPEEMQSLRRIANKIPMKLFSIAFIELCERFSYYGCTVVCKFYSTLNTQSQSSNLYKSQTSSSSLSPLVLPPVPTMSSLVPLEWVSEPRQESLPSTSSGST